MDPTTATLDHTSRDVARRPAAGGTEPARKAGPVAAALVFAGVAVASYLAWVLRAELVLLFAAALFGIALYAVSSWLARKTGMSRKVAVVLSYLAGFLVVSAFVWLMSERVVGQFDALRERVPPALLAVEEGLAGKPILGWFVEDVRGWREAMDGDGGRTAGSPSDPDLPLGRIARLTFGGLSSLVIWAMLTFYVAYDGDRYARFALRLVPPRRRHVAEEVVSCLAHTLPRWLVGRFASMGVVTVLTAIGLLILQVPLAMTLALIAGVASFVPFLGPILALAPALLVTLDAAAPTKLLWVCVTYLLVQFVESYLITPAIEVRAVSVLPVILISAQVLLGVLVGIPGVMFATPLILTLIVIVQIAYQKHGLGEEVDTPCAAP